MRPVILTTRQGDACSFYRGIGPLSRLKQRGLIDLIVADQVDWTTLSQANIVFMMRPEAPWHLQLAKLCNSWSVPLWVDVDDDLLAVPEDNPTHRHYSSKATQAITRECFELASVITTSTPALADTIKNVGPRVLSIPNALDPRFKISGLRSETGKLILWRGSKTHDKDIEVYSDAIVAAAMMNQGWRWHFQGYNPWRLVERLRHYGDVTWSDPLPVEDYMRFLSEAGPTIMIVPLVDNAFNRSKSNIAWIEGTLAGAKTLAPDWDEWRRSGVTHYHGDRDFVTSLLRLMNEGDSSKQAQSADYIKGNLMLDGVNIQRMSIIQQLLSGQGQGPI